MDYTVLYCTYIYLFKMIFLSESCYFSIVMSINYTTREASPMYPRPLHTSEIPCEAVGTKITLSFATRSSLGRARKNVPKDVKRETENETLKNISKSEKSSEQKKNVWAWFTNFLFKLVFGQQSRYSSICWTPIIVFLKKFCTIRDGSETFPGNAALPRLTPLHVVDLLRFWPRLWNAWLEVMFYRCSSFRSQKSNMDTRNCYFLKGSYLFQGPSFWVSSR